MRYTSGMAGKTPGTDPTERPPALRLEPSGLPDASLLASALESVPSGLLVLDRERRIVYHNFRFGELWGLSDELLRSGDEEGIRRRVYEQLEDAEAFEASLDRLAEEPEQIHTETGRLTDGRLIERELRPRYGPGGLVGWLALYRDVTAEEEARAELFRSEQRYRRLFESNVAGVFRVSEEGELLECNAAFAGILGYEEPGRIEGMDVARLYVDREDRARFRERLRERGSVRNFELAVRRRDGSVAWLLENSMLVEEPGSERSLIVGTVIDITPRKTLEEELERMAYHDPLTGLPNRRLLGDRARQARMLADRRGTPFALAYLDLVDFKQVNDQLGHEAGDRLLVEVGRRLESALRDADTASRVGGDEFAVLLGEVDGLDGALAAARRLLDAFEDPIAVGGHERRVRLTAGVAVYPRHGSTLDELLSAADEAMYRARDEDDSSVALYAGREGEPGERPTPERLERALKDDELVLHYQPVYDLSDRTLVGAEALVRWEHPDEGVLPAAAFVPMAERSGLIGDIDRLVMRSALRQSAGWIGGKAPRWIAVKLSRGTALDPGTAAELESLANRHGAALERLVLELRRRDVQRDPGRGREAIERLRASGCRVAVRGFRIDHATLAQLRHPSAELQAADLLLLEGDATSTDPTLLAEIVRHGHELDLEVVAVGIESEDQITWIGSSGADLVQGYALGRPVPPDDFPAGEA